MQLYYTDGFVLPLPEGHRFPMSRYALLRERLLERRIVTPGQLSVPPAATDEQLLRVHCPEYLGRVVSGQLAADEQRRIGFPWTEEMVERSRRSVGATIAASRSAMTDRAGVNLAGGTHHAFRDRGAGYCVFNDVAVAIHDLLAAGRIRRAVVIDCDVHQGNGTAALFANHPNVTTVSLHARKAFPARKEISDIDVVLEPGTPDETYHKLLTQTLTEVETRGPFDVVFYLAGADPFEGDTLGGLALTKPGLAQRDRLVFETCRRNGWPTVLTMAGGYARDVRDIVDIQCETIRLATEYFAE